MANLDAVKRAVQEVVAAVKEADGGELAARGKPSRPDAPGDGVDPAPGAPCPECEAGTCEKPEHHMEAMYGEEG
jgi:hypothetical protein